MNRRVKFDADRRAAFLDYLRKGIRRSHACTKVGISRVTFNKWFKDNKKFAEEVLQAEMDANELIEQALFKTALKGNVTAQQVWLYNRNPGSWQDMRNIKLSGDKDNPLTFSSKIDPSELDAQIERYIQQRKEKGIGKADGILACKAAGEAESGT